MIIIKWIVRRYSVRPHAYYRGRKQDGRIDYTYIPGQAKRFDTKEEAVACCKEIFNDSKTIWETEAFAVALKEENNA